MRILHVNHFLDVGGSETMMLQLAQEQKRLGHQVTICSLHGEGPLDSRAAELGIPVVHLYSSLKRLSKIAHLYRYLGQERYDVLHSHWGSWLAVGVSGFLRRVPRVHTNHSNQRRLWFLEHRVASFFTTKVVVLTPFVEPYIAKWVGVPRKKIEVIPNGINLANIEQAPRIEIEGISPTAPVVGMVARLSPPKDYSTFIRAAGIVAGTHPEVRFVAAGTGQLQDQFKSEAAALGLRNFLFLGARSDVPSLLKRMTINVLCTRHEGHPISLVEALASGCPCIGSDIPSVRFTLEDGRSGLLVAGNDPAALAAGIVRLLDDPALRARLSARGREYAQQFGVRQMAQSYLAVYLKAGARSGVASETAPLCSHDAL
jgi:glycosyltransferase involved in cell wall biosynthesis